MANPGRYLYRLDDPNFSELIQEALRDDSLEDEADSDIAIVDDSDKDPDYVISDQEDGLTEDESGNSSGDDGIYEHTGPPHASPENENMPSRSQVYLGRNNFTWDSNEPNQRLRAPERNIIRGLPALLPPAKCLGRAPMPIELWQILFDEPMINEIVIRTNKKLEIARIKISNKKYENEYRNTNKEELLALFAAIFLTSIYKSSRENMKFLFSSSTAGRPIFRAIMSGNRFQILTTCLRFDDTETRNQRSTSDKAAAISWLFRKFVDNCKKPLRIGELTCIDEMLVPFRGRCGFRVYMPNKPAKYGLKIMALTDARSSYFYDAYLYTGKDCDGIGLSNQDRAKFSKPTQCVLRLSECIRGTNRNITADNYFTSVELVQELLERGLTYVGTVRRNKKEVPEEFLSKKSRQIGSALFGFSNNMCLTSFVPKKNKCVLLMSTMHNSKNFEDGKPEVIQFYNKTKGGVDVLDFKCALYSSNRKTRRWPLAIFYRILDISACNAFLLYLCFEGNNIINRSKFIKLLSFQLMLPHLNARLANPNVRQSIKELIKNVIEEAHKELPGSRPSRRLREPEPGPSEQAVSDRLDEAKTCKFCPPKLKRKTHYRCMKCVSPICLQCTRKYCKILDNRD